MRVGEMGALIGGVPGLELRGKIRPDVLAAAPLPPREDGTAQL
ncbi:hypothetical protein ABZ297_19595 [Nonomuraea sp. NPDC005983]